MRLNRERLPMMVLLAVIAAGIWMLVLQNLGHFTSRQEVEVWNTVETRVQGGYLSVDGSVSVDNTVDVNLQQINGHRNVFYNNYSRGDRDKYYRIPVITE